jgi:hypothetical protein
MPITSQPSDSALLEAEAPKRVLLCEGYDDAFVPEAAYVRQGNKVWKAFGESADLKLLCEAEGGPVLVESMEALELVEDSDGSKRVKDGLWLVEGPAQRSDTKNKNGRTYPRKIWEKWVGDMKSPLQETIKARGALGHLEHPKDGRTDGNEGALLVVEAKLRQDGVVWSKFEVLDTPKGKIVQEYIRKKVRWGVSSRGAGTVDESGIVSIVDFVPETWDAVMRPSTPGAYPILQTPAPASGKKTVVEGTTTDDSGKPGSSMTDVQKVFEDRLSAIRRKIDKLDSCDESVASVEAVVTDLLEAARTGVLTEALALRLVSEANACLREAFDSLAALKVVESATQHGVQGGGAFNTVIAMLKKQVAESVSEVEALKAQVEKAEDYAERQAAARIKAVDECDAKSSEVASLTKRLEEACDNISALSEPQVPENHVGEAVDLLLTKYPVLAESADALRALSSVSEVVEVAVPTLLRASRPAAPAPLLEHATVPTGLVLEAEIIGQRSASQPPSAGSPAHVGLAAAVVGFRKQ